MGPVKIGEILSGTEERDAVHVALAPVVATEKLAPGQDIGFCDDGDRDSVSASADVKIGIVDPFLKALVFPNQRFWMFVYPNTVTSLRHEWTHPEFTRPTLEAAEAWLKGFAEKCGLSYGSLMDAARSWRDGGDYHIEYDTERGCDAMYEFKEEFWKNFDVAENVVTPPERRGVFFSCSC